MKHIIFDRDGTLIKHVHYLHDKNLVELFPDVKSSLKKLIKLKYNIYLHTNQSGVGRGIYSKEQVVECNKRMIQLIGLGDDIFKKTCIAYDYPPFENSYRKPSPKFGKEIISKFQATKTNLYYIGDAISDLETAKNIGCKAIGVNTGVDNLKTELKKREDLNFPFFESLESAINKITNE